MNKHEEKRFENQVKEYLTGIGAWWYKTMGTSYTRAGVPDILAVYRGRMLGLEVKATHGRPSALQLREIDLIRQAGGYARILYPEDFESFKRDMERMKEDINVQPQESGKSRKRAVLPHDGRNPEQHRKDSRAGGKEQRPESDSGTLF